MFNIKQFVNRITDNRSDRDPGETSASFVESEEQHSAEGFLCPPCMKAFPSAEALEEHYNKTHAFDDGAPVVATSPSNGDLQQLRHEIQNLQFSLADEKANSEELKREMLKMQADLNVREMDATSLRSQEREFEDSKSLFTSEVTLLRQQLADSLEQISLLRKEKDAIAKTANLAAEETETVKKEVVSLQTQLSHRNSIDDAEVLRQELVSVQKMMNDLALEKEKEIELLNNKLNEIQSTASNNDSGKLEQALSEIQELKQSREAYLQESSVVERTHQEEMSTKSNKISELQELLQSSKKKTDLVEQECDQLKSECTRLREQHTELCSKIEIGEGARAALEGLQKENDVLKQNLDVAQNEMRELNKQQCTLNLQLEKLSSEYKHTQESLDAKMNEAKALQAQMDTTVSAKNEEIQKLKQKAADIAAEVQTKVSELTKLQKEVQVTKEQVANLNTSLSKSVEKEKQYEKAASEQKSRLETLQNEQKELTGQLKSAESAKVDLQKSLTVKNEEINSAKKSLDSAQGKVEELQRALSLAENELKHTRENFENQVASLEGKLSQESAKLLEKSKDLQDLKQLHEEQATNSKNQIVSLETEVNEKNAKLEALTQSTNELREECNLADQKRQLLQTNIDELIKQKIQLEQDFASNEDEKLQLLEKLISHEAEVKTLNTTIEELSRKRDDAMAALQELGRENQSLQIEIAKIQGRKWADDSNVSNCSCCSKEFTLTIRKHHCRHCGQIFCNDCSSKSASVPSSKKPVRVCDGCFIKLTTP